MNSSVLTALRDELIQNIDDATRSGAQRFFREPVKVYGVKSATVKRIAKKYYLTIRDREKPEIFSLCENLLRSNYLEEASIAFEWSYALRSSYVPEDFPVFEKWVCDYVDNWAKCDTLCNHTLGSFIEQYPQYIRNLKAWSRHDNRWVRRASAVTLILPARSGAFLEDVFEISNILLKDKDDMVQKGYGWMLKGASKKHQEEVFNYIMARKDEMPRTALRYSIEKMPQDLRKKAMEK